MRDIRATRTVIKIGTNTICDAEGKVDAAYLDDVARQLIGLERMGVQSIIVTSGAIGTGSSELGLDGVQKDIPHKQACAAVGQMGLAQMYETKLSEQGIGSALVAAVEQGLRAKGCLKVNLLVRPDNKAAIGLYRTLGYADSGMLAMGKELRTD